MRPIETKIENVSVCYKGTFLKSYPNFNQKLIRLLNALKKLNLKNLVKSVDGNLQNLLKTNKKGSFIRGDTLRANPIFSKSSKKIW